MSQGCAVYVPYVFHNRMRGNIPENASTWQRAIHSSSFAGKVRTPKASPDRDCANKYGQTLKLDKGVLIIAIKSTESKFWI